MTLFVYGTLMRGEENHHLLAGAEPLGAARTAPRYRLADLGRYPALVEGGDISVTGELWRVEPELLATLDELEGHPTYFRRTEVALADGTTAQAYVFDPPGDRVIPSGDWRRRGQP